MSDTKLNTAADPTPAASDEEIARWLSRIPVGELSDAQLMWAFADRLARSPTMADRLLDAGVELRRSQT